MASHLKIVVINFVTSYWQRLLSSDQFNRIETALFGIVSNLGLINPKQILIYVKHCRQRLSCHVSYRCIWLDRLWNKKYIQPKRIKIWTLRPFRKNFDRKRTWKKKNRIRNWKKSSDEINSSVWRFGLQKQLEMLKQIFKLFWMKDENAYRSYFDFRTTVSNNLKPGLIYWIHLNLTLTFERHWIESVKKIWWLQSGMSMPK